MVALRKHCVIGLLQLCASANLSLPFSIYQQAVPKKNAQTEASVMRKLLHAHAIPDTSILLEDTASDTFASIKACSAVLRRLKHPKRAPLYFATSTYHAPRCWVLLRLAGWMPHAVPYHPFPIFPQSSYAKVLLIVAHEILATLWDSLLVLLWRIVR